MNLKILYILFLLALVPQNTCAKALNEYVHDLKILPIQYGENRLAINGKNLSIIRGKLITGDAWEQDNYIVLLQQKDMWQVVANEKQDVVVARSIHHTEEDSISSAYFMIPRDNKFPDNIKDIYLLTISRHYQVSPLEKVQAKFSLLKFDSDELGRLYFHELETLYSKSKYCNSDSAAYHELKIPLPYSSGEFPCLE